MPYAPGQTTGFNSVSDYLSANQGTLDREASDVNSLVDSELDSGKTAADQVANNQWGRGPDYTTSPGYFEALTKQNAAQQDAENTKSQGGLQDLLGHTAMGHGATGFDGMLLNAHGGFGDVQHKAETLHDYLNTTAASHTSGMPAGQGEIDPGRTGGGGIGGAGATPAPQPGNPEQPPLGPTQSTPNKGPGDVYPQVAGKVMRTRSSPFTMGGF